MQYEIYSHNECPYCVLAKELLEREGHTFVEYNVREPDIGARFKVEGFTKVPQVFLNGQHIGGYDRLVEHFATQTDIWDFPT